MSALRMLLTIVALFLAAASNIHADTLIDPRIVIGGGGDSIRIHNTSFTFNSNVNGGGFHKFYGNSGF